MRIMRTKTETKTKMKKLLLAISATTVLGLALFMSGCRSSHQETPEDPVALSDASVGDIVVFGDIRWYVIAKTDTGCTLLSEKPVIKMPFSEAGYQRYNTWDTSTVRVWLNDKFYNAFSEEEKALIALTHNINSDNPEYGTPGGSDTDDHIYLLSLDEAGSLDKKVRDCGEWYGMGHQWWWLRSPGVNASYTAYVGAGNNSDAKIDPDGDVTSNNYGAVRPAMNLRFSDQNTSDQNTSDQDTSDQNTSDQDTSDQTARMGINRTPAEVEAELASISDAQIGDVVAFGRYTWYVTDRTDGICTLLCQGPVANMPYNDSKSDTTWENCSLRRWLNEDFYNSKFSDGEKAAIVTSHNTYTEDDTHYEMDCGNDTDDKVYLFSYSESETVSDDIRACGIDWWLRSPGERQDNAVYALAGGSWNLMGNDVDYSFGVRPVIKVKVKLSR